MCRWLVLTLIPVVLGFDGLDSLSFQVLRSMRQQGSNAGPNVVLAISDAHGTSFAATVRDGARPSPFQYTARGKLNAMRSDVDLVDWESKSMGSRFLQLLLHGEFPVQGGVLIGDPEHPDGWWAISGLARGTDDEALFLRWANETGNTLHRHKGWLHLTRSV